jgi:hypothetical protein
MFFNHLNILFPPIGITTYINIQTRRTEMVRKWINARLSERTTLDGAVLIGAGIAFLIFKPIASLVAYGAIAYGAWTIWKKED